MCCGLWGHVSKICLGLWPVLDFFTALISFWFIEIWEDGSSWSDDKMDFCGTDGHKIAKGELGCGSDIPSNFCNLSTYHRLRRTFLKIIIIKVFSSCLKIQIQWTKLQTFSLGSFPGSGGKTMSSLGSEPLNYLVREGGELSQGHFFLFCWVSLWESFDYTQFPPFPASCGIRCLREKAR